jgi:hypothetical protein
MSTEQVAKEAPSADAELAILFPEDGKITVGGKELVIKPIKWKQIRQVLALVSAFKGRTIGEPVVHGDGSIEMPAVPALTAGEVLELFNSNSEVLTKALAAASGQEEAFIDELDVADVVKLAAIIVKVNADFFTTQVLPLVTKILGGKAIVGNLLAGLKSQSS